MPGLSILDGVLVKAVSDVPFAVGSDGTVFVNVTHCRGVDAPEVLLELALAQQGQLFIGVSLEPDEVRRLLAFLDEGARETVAYVLGARMWKGGDR